MKDETIKRVTFFYPNGSSVNWDLGDKMPFPFKGEETIGIVEVITDIKALGGSIEIYSKNRCCITYGVPFELTQ